MPFTEPSILAIDLYRLAGGRPIRLVLGSLTVTVYSAGVISRVMGWAVQGGNRKIWVTRPDGSSPVNLTSHSAGDAEAVSG